MAPKAEKWKKITNAMVVHNLKVLKKRLDCISISESKDIKHKTTFLNFAVDNCTKSKVYLYLYWKLFDQECKKLFFKLEKEN